MQEISMTLESFGLFPALTAIIMDYSSTESFIPCRMRKELINDKICSVSCFSPKTQCLPRNEVFSSDFHSFCKDHYSSLYEHKFVSKWDVILLVQRVANIIKRRGYTVEVSSIFRVVEVHHSDRYVFDVVKYNIAVWIALCKIENNTVTINLKQAINKPFGLPYDWEGSSGMPNLKTEIEAFENFFAQKVESLYYPTTRNPCISVDLKSDASLLCNEYERKSFQLHHSIMDKYRHHSPAEVDLFYGHYHLPEVRPLACPEINNLLSFDLMQIPARTAISSELYVNMFFSLRALTESVFQLWFLAHQSGCFNDVVIRNMRKRGICAVINCNKPTRSRMSHSCSKCQKHINQSNQAHQFITTRS